MSEEILKRYKIRAKKNLGQNFLINEEIIEEIWDVIDTKWKNIIEVGPWYWALTKILLQKRIESLNLVELDKDMINILENRILLWELKVNNKDFKINNIDVLKYYPSFKGRELGGGNYSVIANIPYYITSPILNHFLYKLENTPDEMVILMQKDVWDKILEAQIPKKWKVKSSVIWLMIAKKATVSEEIFVWKENFIPAPKVESSVLLFNTHKKFSKIQDKEFLKYIKIWFSASRKKLIKNFVNWWLNKDKIKEIFNKLNISENCRWEELNINIWCNLVEELNNI